MRAIILTLLCAMALRAQLPAPGGVGGGGGGSGSGLTTLGSGTITLSSAVTANTTNQEFTLINSGLAGSTANIYVCVWEDTQAVSTSGASTISVGRTGGSTNAEWVPAFAIKVAGGQNASCGGVSPAVVGASNTYTAIVLNLTCASNCATGGVSNFTQGVLKYYILGTTGPL
jgi:hypothetical protein